MLRDIFAKTLRALDFNLVIALGALLVSLLTASVALYQTKMFADQLSAAVWPYLSFNGTASLTTYELDLENDGAGPAIIDAAQVFVDRKPQPSVIAALGKLGLTSQGHHFQYSTIEPGQVIRPGASAMILRVAEPHLNRRLGAAYKRVDVSVHYCSLLNRCWVVRFDSREPNERPREVKPQSYPQTSIGTE